MNWFSKLFKHRPKMIVICGPTATGKTSLSIEIAKKYNGEIISTDSRQIYTGLDIGSAKVTKEEMQNIPHHMIDIAHPSTIFTVQEFTTKSKKIIEEILSRNKTPILCGGTGFYIDAVVYNQSFPKVPPNPILRNSLNTLSPEELFNTLQKKDPRRALQIDKKNKVRLIRALEVIDALGTVPSQKTSSPYKTLFIGLDLEKEFHKTIIHKRIIDRLENQEMLQEAIKLHSQGLSYERMESLGLEYRYMARYLQNKISYDEMINELAIKTNQFAKRQRTWFKRNKKIQWFNPLHDKEEINIIVKNFLK